MRSVRHSVTRADASLVVRAVTTGSVERSLRDLLAHITGVALDGADVHHDGVRVSLDTESVAVVAHLAREGMHPVLDVAWRHATSPPEKRTRAH
jgi:hypothetical protein